MKLPTVCAFIVFLTVILGVGAFAFINSSDGIVLLDRAKVNCYAVKK
ncbi:MAG: hypothetical protein R3B45_11955 [Bdellovibrionota bacterium]